VDPDRDGYITWVVYHVSDLTSHRTPIFGKGWEVVRLYAERGKYWEKHQIEKKKVESNQKKMTSFLRKYLTLFSIQTLSKKLIQIQCRNCFKKQNWKKKLSRNQFSDFFLSWLYVIHHWVLLNIKMLEDFWVFGCNSINNHP
jgi:hypothetical protein